MYKPNTDSLRRALQGVIQDAQAAEDRLVKATSRGTFERNNGTTYTYTPIEGATRHLADAAHARGAALLATEILGHERAGEPNDAVLIEAARYYSAAVMDGRADGSYSSHAIDNAVAEHTHAGRVEFAREVARELHYIDAKVAERVKLEAEKFAHLIAVAALAHDPLTRAVAAILTDPTQRGALDPDALARLQAPFGYTASYVADAVQADLDAAQAEQRARYEADQKARADRLAVQCTARTGRSRCDKTGRYEVTVEPGLEFSYRLAPGVNTDAPVRICGTHLKSTCHAWDGKWHTDVLKVVDTKDGSIVYGGGPQKAAAKV